ncbi:hypothetical protein MUK42_32859, partial [Musa troglodytarum]
AAADKRGVSKTLRGTALEMVNPCFSSMSSSSSPSGSLQSKECTKAPNMYCTNTMPVSFPSRSFSQLRRMNSKSLPWGRTWLLAAGDEAVGVEHQRVRPHLRVPPDGPDVDEEATVAGDAVAVHLALLVGEVRQAERGGRVQTQRFLAHRLQVCQLGQVRLFQQAVSPHHRVCLRLRSLQDSRVPQHLRHGPLHGDGGCVCARREQILLTSYYTSQWAPSQEMNPG